MSSRSKRHRKTLGTTTELVPVEEKSACPVAQPCEAVPTLRAERPLPTHDEVAIRAREIWEARGRPGGQDLTIWFAAEAELFGRSN